MSSRTQRKTVLIRPHDQLRWGGIVLVMLLLVTLFQALAFQVIVTRASEYLPNDEQILMSELPGMILEGCLLTALFTGPMMLLAALFLSLRVFGPVHRMEQHLAEVANGGSPGPLNLRPSDQLHSLADAINAALAARSQETSTADEGEDQAAA